MNQNIYENICAKYQVDTCSEEACRGVFQKTALLKNPIYDSSFRRTNEPEQTPETIADLIPVDPRLAIIATNGE